MKKRLIYKTKALLCKFEDLGNCIVTGRSDLDDLNIHRLLHLFLSFSLWNRKRFSNKNQILVSSVLHKEECISFIKFIGRQYDLLTKTMERINICYSLQVKWFLAEFTRVRVISFRLHHFWWFPGDGEHWGWICLFDFNILLPLPIHSS